MQRKKNKRKKPYEIYPLSRSPLSQNPKQRDLAKLVGHSRDDLRRLINYKEQFIIRRDIEVNGKLRALVYPTARLRGVHERLKFHLNKVQQPEYLFSPRKGYSQRDNAAEHLEQKQYLSIDIRQFYPSTTFQMVKQWGIAELGMLIDVAGMLAEIATVDGIVSFGSPLTPVLVSLVHRKMFDDIHDLCVEKNLRISLWVDDLTISGDEISGDTIEELRKIIRLNMLRSHKVKFKTGNRPVFITGIGVVGRHLVAPASMHLKIKYLWSSYHEALTFSERKDAGLKLLSLMGTVRHITGAKSEEGQKLANRMNSLRQHLVALDKVSTLNTAELLPTDTPKILSDEELPWAV